MKPSTASPTLSSGRRAADLKGVTLVEICVVLALAVVLGSTAAPSLRNMVDTRRLDRTATGLASDLQFVRSESVARNQALRLSRYATSSGSCYVIHTGAAAQCSCSQPGPAQCTDGAAQLRTVELHDADRVSLQGSTHSMLFDPLHGTVSPTATLRVIGIGMGTGTLAVHHVVNVMGRVRSCSPLAAMPGYRAC